MHKNNNINDMSRIEARQMAAKIASIYSWEISIDKMLKAQPEGFFFESKGVVCEICLEKIDGEMWRDMYGFRCVSCQDAYERRLLPKYVIQGKRGYTYVTGSYLHHRANLSVEEIKDYTKQGKLKPRILPNKSSSPQSWIFLRSENPFLKQYLALE